jgi:hypothetical protein
VGHVACVDEVINTNTISIIKRHRKGLQGDQGVRGKILNCRLPHENRSVRDCTFRVQNPVSGFCEHGDEPLSYAYMAG